MINTANFFINFEDNVIKSGVLKTEPFPVNNRNAIRAPHKFAAAYTSEKHVFISEPGTLVLADYVKEFIL